MERKDKKKRGIKRRGRGEGVEQGEEEKYKKDKEEEGKEWNKKNAEENGRIRRTLEHCRP